MSANSAVVPVVWQHTDNEQERFVALSGDANPLHIDAVAARRLQFGGTAVHGINIVLRAIEAVASAPLTADGEPSVVPVDVPFVRARFRSPVLVGATAEYRVSPVGPRQWSVDVVVDSRVRAEVEFAFGPPGSGEPAVSPGPVSTICRELEASEVASATGAVPLALDPEQLSRMFPHTARTVSAIVVAQLLATTRLVGMECPGLHSVYRSLDLRFGDDNQQDLGPAGFARRAGGSRLELEYRVQRFDERFGLVRMDVTAWRVTGTVEAAIRARPVIQASMDVVRSVIDRQAWPTQRALVIGGSRGLGEVATRILAAGGADVAFTYRVGRDDALSLADDLAPSPVRTVELDVTWPSERIHEALDGLGPSHLYYFATPFIPVGDGTRFDVSAFAGLCAVYVSGLWNVTMALRDLGPAPEAVFVPSSVYVDRPPHGFAEYAAAKAAGEGLCRALQTAIRGLRVHVARLEPLSSDQTAGVRSLDTRRTLERMALELRRFVLDAGSPPDG